MDTSGVVSSTLSEYFMGDGDAYAGPFQRELTVRAGAGADRGSVAREVVDTAKYAQFLSDRVATLVASMMDGSVAGGMADRVSGAVAARARAGGAAPRMADLQGAIVASPEWSAFQRERIAKVAGMVGVQVTEEQVGRLMSAAGVDELRAALEARGGAPAADEAAAVEAAPPAAPPVDDAWMDEFAAEYGREPSVHEYMHIRRLQARAPEALAGVRERHVRALTDFQAIHRDYLGERLSEAAFARRYLPGALTDDLADAHREATLASEAYRRNMRARLGALHNTLFGEDLSEEEGAFLFERDVRARKLSLQSDRLNDVVVAFAEQTTRLSEVAAGVYRACLGREPEDAELRAVLHGFRVDEAAAAARLRAQLTASLEYREVLRAAAVRQQPGLSVPAVFRLLERVLALPDLAALEPEDAVRAAAGGAPP